MHESQIIDYFFVIEDKFSGRSNGETTIPQVQYMIILKILVYLFNAW